MKMRPRAKKKVRLLPQDIGDEDRISRLPDELLHKILSSLDAKVAVQTSVLSRRWKPVWTSLPFLTFGWYGTLPQKVSKFINHVLSKRNHQSHLSELNFRVYTEGFSKGLLEKFVKYAVSRNVQSLRLEISNDHKPYKLSTFSSKSLEKLTLKVNLEECALQSDYWDLPALTTLHLRRLITFERRIFPISWLKDSWLTCLPTLTTLCLYDWDMSKEEPFSFSLPALKTLHLSHCKLPKTVWDLPALTSLELDTDTMHLPEDLSDTFSALINLQNLTLNMITIGDYFITCPPQLLNLRIRSSSDYVNIVVSAPKLCHFTFFGIFVVTILVPDQLENVSIRLKDWFMNKNWICTKKYYRRLTNMLPGIGNAKNLTFDSESIEALNNISDLLESLPSPFCKLKFVKLPWGFKESTISSALRSYLLGGSPKAAIITEFPQNHGVEDSIADADRVRHTDSAVEGTDKDEASSSRRRRDSGLWRSHEVNYEFVCLLDRIMHKYPETFEHFTTKNKKLCTMNLNLLCTLLNDFTKISMTDVDSEMIVGYKEVFSCLQNQGFNISWMVNRLNYIEHLRFSKPLISELHSIDCHIDDAKSELQELQASVEDAKINPQDLLARVDDAKIKLQDVQTLRMEKLSEIEKAFGTLGTNLAVGFIGDDLLSNP